ncbi:MAG: 16S rRNA (cytidine(1402)-2'-O)-methyltransferase [Ruminococcus sp.]|nr:16S rRNA (cytidine(1402)-2'-O)-methyltransferase [Ruminococcus sp.]
MGILYIVGTPIGNLGDMTFRAVETLKSVDFICAEDTRVTAKLLNHFEIKKPLVSYHEHNARRESARIAERILNGENAAIVTDAGMPCISDPGELLVRECADRDITVTVVPGATAAMSAAAVSGLPTRHIAFHGFLSTDKKERRAQLAAVKNSTDTLVFYEAPHKLSATLDDLLTFLGDRRVSLCRELTKLHEEIFRTTLSEAAAYYKDKEPRGEFVLVIEGSAELSENEDSIESALEQVKGLAENGMRPADACREIAKVTRFSKGELYTAFLEENGK